MSLSCCTVRVIVFRHLVVVSCTQGRLVPLSCRTERVNHCEIQHQINPMRQIQEGITLLVAVSMRRDMVDVVSVAKKRRTSDGLPKRSCAVFFPLYLHTSCGAQVLPMEHYNGSMVEEGHLILLVGCCQGEALRG